MIAEQSESGLTIVWAKEAHVIKVARDIVRRVVKFESFSAVSRDVHRAACAGREIVGSGRHTRDQSTCHRRRPRLPFRCAMQRRGCRIRPS